MRTAEFLTHNDWCKPSYQGHPNSSMASSSIQLSLGWPQPLENTYLRTFKAVRRIYCLFHSTLDIDPCPLFIRDYALNKGLTVVNPSCPFEMYLTAEPDKTGLILFLTRYWVFFQEQLNKTLNSCSRSMHRGENFDQNTWNQSSSPPHWNPFRSKGSAIQTDPVLQPSNWNLRNQHFHNPANPPRTS